MRATATAARREQTAGRRLGLAVLATLFAWLLLVSAPADAHASHSYPRLCNIYFPSLGEADLELLSRWDLLVLSKRAEDRHQAELAQLRALNPDITLIAHFAVGYNSAHTDPPINADLSAEIEANNWWLRDTNGGIVTFGSGGETRMLNMTLECPTNAQGQRLCDWLPEYAAERLYAGGRWDGIFLDYAVDRIAWRDAYLEYPQDHDLDGLPGDYHEMDESWRLGMRLCAQKLRDLVGDDFLLVTNGNNTLYDLCDGDTRESFPRMHGDWYANMMNEEHGYLAFEAKYRHPTTNIINSIWYGDATPDGPARGGEFEREFKFGLTSTLVFGSGYFSCDGPAHTEAWWIEYYDIDLGEPLGRAEDVNVLEGSIAPWVDLTELIKMRRFENGIAVINPCLWIVDVPLEGAYYDIHSWNGQFYEHGGLRTSVKLSWQTGEVLVGNGVVPTQKVGSAQAVASRDAVVLSWDRVDGASSYSIYRAKVDSSGNAGHRLLVSVVDEPFYTDRDIPAATVYRYFIAPIDELNCEGQQSRAIDVSTEPGSDLFTALRVDELDELLALHWDPPVVSDPPLVSCELERVDEGGHCVRLTDEPLNADVTSYDDGEVVPGMEYVYSLVRRSGGTKETLASVRARAPSADGSRTTFAGVRPQPASTRTSVSFTLADVAQGGEASTRLYVYDVAGRLVRRLVDEPMGPGEYAREWDLRGETGARVASGCYLFELERGGERTTAKVLVLR